MKRAGEKVFHTSWEADVKVKRVTFQQDFQKAIIMLSQRSDIEINVKKSANDYEIEILKTCGMPTRYLLKANLTSMQVYFGSWDSIKRYDRIW